jgi:pimeloyl-ACP methyl ester carboxylesterase
MSSSIDPIPFEVLRQLPGAGSLTLRGEQAGPLDAGVPAIVLLHGVSATRRNVVHGSRHLARRGYRMVAYDARGHGDSDPAPSPDAYGYPDLIDDLCAVVDELALERPVLVGASMGAATALAFALKDPARVPALVQITPAYTGRRTTKLDFEVWDRMADELKRGGVEQFVKVATPDELPERWRELARRATRQRMEKHEHVDAVSDALHVVPRSRAFDGLEKLEGLEVPTLIVASRDEVDGVHPLEVAREYAERLPQAELIVDDEGETPLAWEGARLSGLIGDFLERLGIRPQR